MDVQGGQIIQSPGNPVFPGTRVTGPFLAGNILRTGGPNAAGLGSTDQGSLANVGYASMMQVGRFIEQAAPFASPDLVIPAQSLIIQMSAIALVNFNNPAINVGTASNPVAFGTLNASGTFQVITGTVPPIWINVGNQDVQIVIGAAGAGPGVGLFIIEYIQGINAPLS